jgi:hypothetical protein
LPSRPSSSGSTFAPSSAFPDRLFFSAATGRRVFFTVSLPSGRPGRG